MSTILPVRRQVRVPADRLRAFEIFTGAIGRWWPLTDHSVFGASSSVSFEPAAEGSQIVEVSPDGRRAV